LGLRQCRRTGRDDGGRGQSHHRACAISATQLPIKPRGRPMALARHFQTPQWAAVATAVIGIALSLLLALRQARSNDELIETQLQARGGRIAQQLFDRLHVYEYGLRATRGVAVVVGEDTIDQALFRRYIDTRDIDREFPGARG